MNLLEKLNMIICEDSYIKMDAMKWTMLSMFKPNDWHWKIQQADS